MPVVARIRRSVRSRAAVAAVGVLAATGAVGAPVSAAPLSPGQDPSPAVACGGVVVSASIASEVVPGGAWSVTDACVEPGAAYEVNVFGYRLVGGLGAAVYDEGHRGRVAFATVAISPDRSLSLVGLEDVDTGTVVWAYADAGYAEDVTSRTSGGAATAVSVVGPPEGAATPAVSEPVPAEATISLRGDGTDLATAEGPIADELRSIVDEAVGALTD